MNEKQPRAIGLLLTSPADRQLLTSLLSQEGHTPLAPSPSEADPSAWGTEVDAVIADEHQARRWREALLALKEQSGAIFMPLLIALPHGADSAPWLEAGFDDVVRLPTRQADLTTRLNVLWRLREQSQVLARQSESEAMFRALVEQSMVGVYLIVEGRFAYVNAALASIFGYRVDELVGRLGPQDLTAPQDRERVEENIRRRLSGQVESVHYTFRGLRQDGSTIWVEVFGRRLEYRGRVAILGTLIDITKRVQAQEALRQNEQFLNAILESIQNGISVLSPDLTIRHTNSVMKKWYARNLPLEGKPCYVAYHDAEEPCAVCPTLRCIQSGRVEQNTVPGLPGSPIEWLEIFSYPMTDPDTGEVIGVVEFVRDITKRVQAQEALRTKIEQLTALGQTAQALTRSLELDQVLSEIVSLAGEVTNADYASVLLMDAPGSGPRSAENITGIPSLEHRTRADGFTDWIIRTHRSVIIDAIGPKGEVHPALEDAPRTANPAIIRAGVQSFAGLPLIAKGRLLGVLYLHSTRPGAFSDQSTLLTAFASQAATAIENAHLYAQERLSRQRAEALRRAAQAVSTSLDLHETLRLILEQLKHIVTYDTASVLILEQKGVDLVVGLGYADQEMTGREARRLLADSPILARMTQDLQPVLSDDVRQLEGWIWVPGAEHVRSWMGVPLVARDRMIGVLMADSAQVGFFGQDDLRAVQTLAQHAAQAIENARLYAEVQRGAAHQQALNAIIAAATVATDMPGLLRVALAHSLKALNVEMGSIWVRDQVISEGLPTEPEKMWPEHADLVLTQPVAIDDWEHPPAPYKGPSASMTRLGIRASITVPILADEQPIGGLSLSTSRPRRWTDAEIALAEAVGCQLGAVAERLRLLTQIQEQARQLVQIMETVPEGVLLLDAEGRVLSANPPAERALNLLAGRQVLERDEPVTRLGDRPLAEVLTSPPVEGLWHEVEADGSIFEIIARPIENGPRPEHWVLLLKDATQERQVREQLAQQERLAAVGQLAAGIAHDFNNIMAVVVLYAEMVARSEEMSKRNRERLSVIKQQARHASELIQQILDFGRRAVLERQPLNLLPLVKEQIKLLRRTLPESIQITFEHQGGECLVNADPTRMQQMLTNLAVNARDAMPKGGVLRVTLGRVQVQEGASPLLPEMPAGDWVRLTVSDTGVGIPPAVMPHIFEPFFTTKEPGKGSGLGLAQVHGIVGQHEGRIGVESRVGEGTTFTIYLPALPTEPDTLTSASDLSGVPQGHGERILVVEDEAAVRAALVETLTQLGYQPQEAENGQEALALLEEHGDEIALVLSDVVMPVMGGMALLHAARERGWTRPMILLTGHPMDKMMDELRALGVQAWLSKPPHLETLAQAVFKALTHR